MCFLCFRSFTLVFGVPFLVPNSTTFCSTTFTILFSQACLFVGSQFTIGNSRRKCYWVIRNYTRLDSRINALIVSYSGAGTSTPRGKAFSSFMSPSEVLTPHSLVSGWMNCSFLKIRGHLVQLRDLFGSTEHTLCKQLFCSLRSRSLCPLPRIRAGPYFSKLAQFPLSMSISLYSVIFRSRKVKS